jgi:Ran GTPase-activating protein (RanGAP) involved in mRNA processing and transport
MTFSPNFADNLLGSTGAKILAEALKVNKTLTVVDLKCNHIQNEGAKAVAEALKVNSSIQHLNLKGRDILLCSCALMHVADQKTK